jgi:regulator of protease activity HflC (stomatin/prohibitin superfamily)
MILEVFTVVVGVTIVIGLITLYNSVVIVQEGEVIVIESLGKFGCVKHAGLHFIRPFLDRPRSVHWTRRIEQRQANGRTVIVDDVFDGHRIRTQNIVFDIPPVSCYTKERVQLDVNIVVFYCVSDVQRAVYEVNDLYAAIELKVQTLLTSVIYDLPVDDITTHALQSRMTQCLTNETWQSDWGIKINRFEIQEVALPQSLAKSTLDAMTQRRTMEADKLSHEALRVKQLSELDVAAQVDAKKREAELAAMQHRIERTRLENEYENEKSRKHVETENLNAKSQQQIEAERRELKYSAMAKSGLSEQYFIERKRAKSMEKIFQAGITGSNKTLIMPYEAIAGNALLTSQLLHPQTPILNTFTQSGGSK